MLWPVQRNPLFRHSTTTQKHAVPLFRGRTIDCAHVCRLNMTFSGRKWPFNANLGPTVHVPKLFQVKHMPQAVLAPKRVRDRSDTLKLRGLQAETRETRGGTRGCSGHAPLNSRLSVVTPPEKPLVPPLYHDTGACCPPISRSYDRSRTRLEAETVRNGRETAFKQARGPICTRPHFVSS